MRCGAHFYDLTATASTLATMFLDMPQKCGLGTLPCLFSLYYKLTKPSHLGTILQRAEGLLVQCGGQTKSDCVEPFLEFCPFLTHRISRISFMAQGTTCTVRAG
jgi:hypothetical protein